MKKRGASKSLFKGSITKKVGGVGGADVTVNNKVKLKEAMMLHQQGRLEQSEYIIKEILKTQPQNINALQLLAVIASQQKKLIEASNLLGQVLKINPDHAGALNSLGVILVEMNFSEQAMDSFERALMVNPVFVDALNNRGKVLCQLGYTQQALDSYERAIIIKPDFIDVLNNRGNALLKLCRFEQALDSFDQALDLNPNFEEALNNRGNALLKLRRYGQALASYNAALEINSGSAEILNNYGNALRSMRRFKDAADSYAEALAIKSDYAFLYGLWLHTKMMICDWRDIDNQFLELTEKIERGEKAASPFQLIPITSSGALQRKAADIYMQAECPVSHVLGDIVKHPKHNKIHIGYFSADFHYHATAFLIAELLELHDKSCFELTAFSFGPKSKDEMRQRMEIMFDRFVEVSDLSDKEVAQQARNLGIDIAVDLKGYTFDSRPGIFALRAAPIQVSYLGYPGTMGAEYIDYLIADTTLIPEAHQKYYTEKIAYLPNSYQVNDTKREIADKTYTRTELGLPATGFVFCCFNNNYKIIPQIFDSWMCILKQVEGSVLWLFEGTEDAASNLRKEAESRGVNSDRLVFAPRLPLPEHLARHCMADLFLDTLPCNAHTTASDALWAGLPVLTCLGETFASRVAASLLNAMHLPELITSTVEDYETLAIELALNPEKLNSIKKKLFDNRLTTPLFNTPLFTCHLEAVYAEMYRRYQADLVPEHFYVNNSNDEKDKIEDGERIFFAKCPLCSYSILNDLISADCSNHPSYHESLNNIIHWKQCTQCLHIFTEGYYTNDIYQLIYSNTSENQKGSLDVENERNISSHMIEKILPYANSGSWLGVKPGNGSLLLTAQEYGFNPVGIDVGIENIQKLKSFGVNVYNKGLGELSLESKCAVISMVDVLEKIPYPQEVLREAYRMLSDKGILFISMPNTENIVWKTLDQNNANPYWGEIEHYHNFSRTRLYQLLKEVGFEPIRYGISERYPVCMDVIARKNFNNNLIT